MVVVVAEVVGAGVVEPGDKRVSKVKQKLSRIAKAILLPFSDSANNTVFDNLEVFVESCDFCRDFEILPGR